jgi:CRISPR-associated protein Cmr3
MVTYLTIDPHDPIIARDGRPFGAGQRMGSLDWLYPSVLAGAVRTTLGKTARADFSKQDTIDSLKRISVSGPLPLWNNRIFLPAPRDIIVREERSKEIRDRCAYAIRPTKMKQGEGCDLPFPKKVLIPAMLPESVGKEFKPAGIPAFWSMRKMVEWLMNPSGNGFVEPPMPKDLGEIKASSEFLPTPQKDFRTHTKIDRELGSAEDEMLFKTIGLDLSMKGHPQGIQLAARVEAEGVLLNGQKAEDIKIDCFSTIGGERRLSHWNAEMPQKGWDFPAEEMREALARQKTGNKKIRMILATPAIFNHVSGVCQGWLPGWLKLHGSDLIGAPKEAPPSLKLKLVSACTDRWRPISGWSLEKGRRGPKPIRRLVPAGSVYFFEVLKGDAFALAETLWLRSVCDNDQDGCDGFGLALLGVWDYSNEKIEEERKQEV